MVWNNIKTAFRVLQKQKLTAFINIIGLGIGLSFFILLVAYVRDDLTFDRFHEKADRTYILTSEFRDRFMGGSHHFIAEMLEELVILGGGYGLWAGCAAGDTAAAMVFKVG